MIIKRNKYYNLFYMGRIKNDYILSAIRVKNVKDDCVLRFEFDKRKFDLIIKKTFGTIIRQHLIVMKTIPKLHIVSVKLAGCESLEIVEMRIIEFFYKNDKLTSKEYWRVLN